MSQHFVRNPRQPELDPDGFPILMDDTIGTLFVSDPGVVYYGGFIRGLRVLGWAQVGRIAL